MQDLIIPYKKQRFTLLFRVGGRGFLTISEKIKISFFSKKYFEWKHKKKIEINFVSLNLDHMTKTKLFEQFTYKPNYKV